MDEPERAESANDYEDGDDPVVPPAHVLSADHGHHGGQGTNNQHIGQEDNPDPPRPHGPWFPWIRREAIGWDRAIELLFAAVIVLFSWLQYESAQSTTRQIQTISDAANQIKSAAWTFSGAAQGIGYAGWSAVDKLNLQAGSLSSEATQAKRLADVTGKANENVLNADRPWFGTQISVQDFEIGKTPVATIIFSNSGKRPAKVTQTAVESGIYEKFPDDPPYNFDTVPSVSVIVPGESLSSRFNATKVVIPKEMFDAVNLRSPTFYIYAKIEYVDIVLNKPHWAHFCWQYIAYSPVIKKDFYGCSIYNDTDKEEAPKKSQK